MRESSMKLRTIRPPPISRTKDSATSATTTALRSKLPPLRPGVRPEERRTSARSGRDARNAGTVPNKAAATIAASVAKLNTSGSMLTSSSRGRFDGASEMRTLMPRYARPRPSSAPPIESTRLSERSWRTMRHGELPIAARMASSRSRDQQHERHCPHQREDRRTHVLHEVIVHRLDPPMRVRRLHDREALVQVLGNALDILIGHRKRNSGLESPDESHEHVVPGRRL